MNFIKKLKLFSKAVQREDQKIRNLIRLNVPDWHLFTNQCDKKFELLYKFKHETGYKFQNRAEIEFLIMMIRVNKIRGSAMSRIGRRAKKENKHIQINRISLYMNAKEPHKIPFVDN